MKYFICFSLFLFISSLNIYSQEHTIYDSTLAQRFGGDDYGMKSYIFVILKTGTNTNIEKSMRDSIFKEHLNNITRLADAGKLVLAGPFGKNVNSYRGLYIFNTTSMDEAVELVSTDPAVKSNLLAAEYYNWYGSATLMDVINQHKKIQKKNFK